VTVQDEGFHEIQLNGKQVVFLFMAATVVSVVIFLCGVLVGRGVRVDRPAMADLGPVSAQAETTPPPSPNPRRPRLRRRVLIRGRLRRLPTPTISVTSIGSRPRAPPRENLKSAVEKRVARGNPVELAPGRGQADSSDKAPAEKATREKADVPPERTTPPPAKPAAPPKSRSGLSLRRPSLH
jgi:hypothetical protein